METLSLQEMKLVPSALLQERLETVKTVIGDELEMYEVAKDKLTEEHYLHYAYMHKQIASMGPESSGEETFHQLMPLDSDDVLALIFSEQLYSYPEAWNKRFLRNGPKGDYVWFDPTYTHDEEDSEAIAQKLHEQLLLFKQTSELTEEAVSKLLKELDRTRDGRE